MTTDHRPPAGWGTDPWGNPTFTLHDGRGLFDTPPLLDGRKPRFSAIHGVGPGSYHVWVYRKGET